MITIEKDIVVGVVFFGYVETFMISSDRSGTVAIICFAFFSYSAPANCHWAGSKLECVELCNFYFCCALIFCQPMKKFEFLGVSRATRQRHFKTSSTGDENAQEVARVKRTAKKEKNNKKIYTLYQTKTAKKAIRYEAANTYIAQIT